MNKLIGFSRWFFIVFLVGIFGLLTEWIMFHPGYLTRNVPYLNKLFWVWMDDSRHQGEDYRVWLSDHGSDKETWWLSYKWHLRNKVWNLNDLFKVKSWYNNEWEITEFVKDELYKNSPGYKKVIQDDYWIEFAQLKYIPQNEDDDIWQVNQGDELSTKTSTLGTGFFWYKIGNWNSFRYSQCKIVNYGFWRGYRTLKFGTNDKRYIFTIKHQTIKPWK